MIGNRGSDCVTIRTGKYDREDWFRAEIVVYCDGWRGAFDGCFMKGELKRLALDLSAIQKSLSGDASLDPLEPNLTLHFSGDGKGHISVKGDACNRFETGTHLTFAFEFDQTYLKRIIDALLAADPG